MSVTIVELDAWAVVELMGHVTHAGRLSEEERFGSKLGRLDIPNDEGGFTTIYFNGSSLYRLTIVSEEVARAKAKSTQPRPVSMYEMPKAALESPRTTAVYRGFDPDDEDIDDDHGDDLAREEDR